MHKLVIIGAGAAGIFCAVNAARMHPGLQVIVVEKTGKLLSKVKVSGGGRCNVTHACSGIAELVKNYPRGGNFLKKAFHHFSASDTIKWFEDRGVALKTEEDGRMFPVTDSSQTIIDCLLREMDLYGVEIRMHHSVTSLEHSNDKWMVEFSNHEPIQAQAVCIACGGYPKNDMYEWVKKTGHSIEAPVPSLFTFNMPGSAVTSLMGVTHKKVGIKIESSRFEQQNPLLITHWGMSGPAVLKLSAWSARELAARNYDFPVVVNWIPAYNESSLQQQIHEIRRQSAASKLINKNPFSLPQRLWEYLLQEAGINADIRWADLPAREQNKLVKTLCANRYAVKGKTTYKEEFVTAGGIPLQEVDPSTMMSKIKPGLFFAGEVLDVDGVTGGFNFQHAWTSGYVAAKAVCGL